MATEAAARGYPLRASAGVSLQGGAARGGGGRGEVKGRQEGEGVRERAGGGMGWEGEEREGRGRAEGPQCRPDDAEGDGSVEAGGAADSKDELPGLDAARVAWWDKCRPQSTVSAETVQACVPACVSAMMCGVRVCGASSALHVYRSVDARAERGTQDQGSAAAAGAGAPKGSGSALNSAGTGLFIRISAAACTGTRVK